MQANARLESRRPTYATLIVRLSTDYVREQSWEEASSEEASWEGAFWEDDEYDETDALMYEGYDGLEEETRTAGNTVTYAGPFLECIQGSASNVVRSGAPRTGYYHSGVNRGLFLSWIEAENQRGMNAGAMVNARSAAQPALLRAYQNHDVPVVMDSGAFQGDMTLGRYLRTIDRIERDGAGEAGSGGAGAGRSIYDRMDWLAVLDEIGDTDLGETNYERMRQRHGIAPLYVHQVNAHKVNAHPVNRHTVNRHTVSGRDNLVFVHAMLGPSEMIGIGGLVPLIRRDVSAACRVIEDIGAALESHQRKAHFFGVGARSILAEFAGEPWFASADSQKWLAGQKARKVYRSDGHYLMVKKAGLKLPRETCARQNLRQISVWAGCTTPGYEDGFSGQILHSTTGADLEASALGLLLTGEEVEANNERVRKAGQVQFGLFDPQRWPEAALSSPLAA